MRTHYEYRSARTEILSVVGPVASQHHPTDQYIGVQCGRELPQLYMKTKLHLLSCVGALSQGVTELQQAWKKLTFYRKNAGLASTEEESVSLLKERKKSVKRAAQSDSTSTKRGRKKAIPDPSSIPVEISVHLEERIHDLGPSPIATDTT